MSARAAFLLSTQSPRLVFPLTEAMFQETQMEMLCWFKDNSQEGARSQRAPKATLRSRDLTVQVTWNWGFGRDLSRSRDSDPEKLPS